MRKIFSFETREHHEVPEKISRIVSLSPSITEILIDMGLSDRIVGISKWCRLLEYYGHQHLSRKAIVGDYDIIDISKLLELRPDIVLLSGGYQLRHVPTLKNYRIPFYVVSLPHTVSDILRLPIEIGYSINEIKRGLALFRRAVEHLIELMRYDVGVGRPLLIALYLEELVIPGAMSYITQLFETLNIETLNINLETSYLYGAHVIDFVKSMNKNTVVLIEVNSINLSISIVTDIIKRYRLDDAFSIVVVPTLVLSDYGPRLFRKLKIVMHTLKEERRGINLLSIDYFMNTKVL